MVKPFEPDCSQFQKTFEGYNFTRKSLSLTAENAEIGLDFRSIGKSMVFIFEFETPSGKAFKDFEVRIWDILTTETTTPAQFIQYLRTLTREEIAEKLELYKANGNSEQ